MHHYVKIALVLCSCLALTTAQFAHFGFPGFSTTFGDPSYINNYAAAAAAAGASTVRDPRADRGPVRFPDSPGAVGGGPTSGVIVGASGYGFVPPMRRGPVFPRYFYRTFYARR